MQLNQIYNQDCLIGMQNIEDKSIDLILCDLPYGILKSKNNQHTQWDDIIPFDALWTQYERIAKDNAAIVLTAVQPFATDLINSNRKLFKYELIWCKSRASGFLNARKMPSKAHENILVFYKKPPIYNAQKYPVLNVFQKRRKAKIKNNSSSKAFAIKNESYEYIDDGTRFPDTLLDFKSAFRKGMHPTEKPIDLFAWLINSYSNVGDLVLDNCMGSGTTALASMLTGRNFIGFERDFDYWKMANNRVEDFRQKLGL